jgi:hypothetical protein
MAEDDVSPEAVPDAQRFFQIDPIARRQVPERRPEKGFRGDIRREDPAGLRGHGQACAADGDAVADPDVVQIKGGLDLQKGILPPARQAPDGP